MEDTFPAVEPLRQQEDDDLDRRRDGDPVVDKILPGSPDISPEMLEQMLEASLSGICIVDRRGCIAFANSALLTILGRGRQDLIGKPADILWLSREEGVVCIDRALTVGQWSGMMIGRRSDSSSFDAQISITAVHNPKNTDAWLVLSCLDIAAQQPTEDLRSRLKLAITAMPARFMDLKEIDRAIDDSLRDLARACGACRTYISLFNDSRTLLGTTHEWCAPKKGPQRGEFQKYFIGDLPWWATQILEGEVALIDGDGQPSWQEQVFLEQRAIVTALMIPLRLDTKIIGFIGIDQDTSGARFTDEDVNLLRAAVHIIASALERRQSEYVFRKSENIYQIVLDSITDSVIVTDTRYTILLANDAFIDWCGELELETVIAGKDLFSVLPFLSPTARRRYERVIQTGRSLTSDRSYQIDDRIITLREIRIPIFEGGEVTRIITVIRDITAQREVEDLKSKAYAQIERNMEQFALLADHIRNPLQTITGYAEMMDDPDASDKIRQQVQRIDLIIDQLDERWAESRRLSMFWRKYS